MRYQNGNGHSRLKLHADIAHPINAECRQEIHRRVIAAYLDELERSKMPGYVAPNLDGEDLDIYDLPATRIPGNGGVHGAVVSGEAAKMQLRPTGTAH
jgi:stage V sporulation protein G